MSLKVILDNFRLSADQGWVVLGILALIVLSQVILGAILKQIFGKQLTSNEYFALSMAGWILPASLIALLWLLPGFQPPTQFNIPLIILISLGVLFLMRLKSDPAPDSKPIFLFLLLFVSISILLRLAFVSRAVLPSYFDSAQHYLLIKSILEKGASAVVFTLPANYYHMGYHFLTTFVVSTLQADIAQSMLILGQMTLAVMPISVFFLIKHITRSNWAGIFAMLLAAWGWYMPAHAVDWGKYPALVSIGLIPFVLSLAYLFVENKDTFSLRKRSALYGLLGVCVFISVFIHSRSLVIFAIAFLAWVIAAWQQKRPQGQRYFMVLIVLIASVLEIIYVQKQEILALVFDPYLHKGVLVTALVLFLYLFAQGNYPQLTFACILAVCFLLGSLVVPVVGLIPGHDNLTLLDRPFVEMILYLPLSLLAGLGLAGLEKNLQQRQVRVISRNGYVGVFAIGLVLMNAFATYGLYPSDCCVLAGHADVAAMDWMAEQLPEDARIGIATTELKVMVLESFEGVVGSDAGIWITPLINRITIPLIYSSEFEQQATLNGLCQTGINYLYVGEMGQNFNDAQLSAHPDWYRILLAMPQVQVYQVVGCDEK